MNHPLYERVKRIVAAKSVDGAVDQRVFNAIRNQSSVRSILAELGYTPNNEIRPTSWSNKPVKTEPPKRKKYVGLYDKFVEHINANGEIYFTDIGLSKSHAQKVASRVRCDGMNISCIFGNEIDPISNRKIMIGYRLDKQ